MAIKKDYFKADLVLFILNIRPLADEIFSVFGGHRATIKKALCISKT
jgi:hypothetical protein